MQKINLCLQKIEFENFEALPTNERPQQNSGISPFATPREEVKVVEGRVEHEEHSIFSEDHLQKYQTDNINSPQSPSAEKSPTKIE